LGESIKIWLKLLAPFAPYTCEELWSQTGEEGFISSAKWPKFDETKVDVAALEQENLIVDIIADTWNILKATKIAPKHICYYMAASWKWQIYLKVLEKIFAGEPKINEIMKEIASDQTMKPHMKAVAGLVPRIIKALTKLSTERKVNMLKIREVTEAEIVKSAVGFFKERFNSEVSVYSEDAGECYDPKQRASMAMPYQPAIFIE